MLRSSFGQLRYVKQPFLKPKTPFRAGEQQRRCVVRATGGDEEVARNPKANMKTGVDQRGELGADALSAAFQEELQEFRQVIAQTILRFEQGETKLLNQMWSLLDDVFCDASLPTDVKQFNTDSLEILKAYVHSGLSSQEKPSTVEARPIAFMLQKVGVGPSGGMEFKTLRTELLPLTAGTADAANQVAAVLEDIMVQLRFGFATSTKGSVKAAAKKSIKAARSAATVFRAMPVAPQTETEQNADKLEEGVGAFMPGPVCDCGSTGSPPYCDGSQTFC